MEAGLKRRLLRGLLWGVVVAAALAAGMAVWVFAVNRTDEALDPAVAKLLAAPPSAESTVADADNGLSQLIGLHAPDGADPEQFAREWLAAAALPSAPDKTPKPFAKVAGRDWPVLQEDKAYDHFTTGANQFEERVKSAGELMPRFHALMQLPSYDDARVPPQATPSNFYVPWLRAHQLELGVAVMAIRAGREAEGFEKIRLLSAHVRQVMQGSHGLPGKRAAMSAQARMAGVLNRLMNDQPGLARNHLNAIDAALSPLVSGQDFRAAQTYELRQTLNALQPYLGQASGASAELKGLDGMVIRNLTLPNATLNLLAPVIEPALKHAYSTFAESDTKLNALDAALKSVEAETTVDSPGKLRNLGGRTLVGALWWPTVPDVKSRALDLDDRLMLIRAQAVLQAVAVPPEDRETFLREKSVNLFPPGVHRKVNYDPAKLQLQMPSRLGRGKLITVQLPAA